MFFCEGDFECNRRQMEAVQTETAKLSKENKRMAKENKDLRTKSINMDVAFLALNDESQKKDENIVLMEKQIDQLKSLCRALQSRQSQQQQPVDAGTATSPAATENDV